MYGYEERQLRRMAMRGVPERLGMSFSGGGFEMRSAPSGAGGTAFEFNGYATVYSAPFPMWDQAGEPFTEVVAPGAARRSLANPSLDVPFLIGHDDSGIPMARTRSGTMALSEDTHGVHVHVPAMDGRREDVRALASAVERGDMSEMSLAFVCNRQAWDDSYEQRTILEMDLHRGDVCAVVHGANPATDGSLMSQVEQLSFRRPAAIGGLFSPERRAAMSAADANDLPDSDFAYIEPGGEKDSSGKTKPRSLRHFPVQDAAHVRNALARAPQSPFGDKAMPAIKAAAKRFGVDVSEHGDSQPYELRASAADVDAGTPDFDVADAEHVTCSQCQASNDPKALYCNQCGQRMGGSAGQSATVTVDDSTGIPGEESQYAALGDLERRIRELELEELARR